MKNTVLCYIENDSKWLMLHRVKKGNDENAGKWIGVGGKFKDTESPHDCVIRETKEETGLELLNPTFRGIVTFVSNEFGTEYMFLFTCNNFCGEVNYDCDEGVLKWVDVKEVTSLELWDGDRLFINKLINSNEIFSMKLVYNGDTLIEAYDGTERIL